jgi:hypothetical protein
VKSQQYKNCGRNTKIAVDNIGLSCNSNSKKKKMNGEWQTLLPKSVPGLIMSHKTKEGIQV